MFDAAVVSVPYSYRTIVVKQHAYLMPRSYNVEASGLEAGQGWKDVHHHDIGARS